MIRVQRHPAEEPVAHAWHRYLVRVWVGGVRVHHGAIGIAGIPVAAGVMARKRRLGTAALVMMVVSAWDDRHDWRVWFVA